MFDSCHTRRRNRLNTGVILNREETGVFLSGDECDLLPILPRLFNITPTRPMSQLIFLYVTPLTAPNSNRLCHHPI